MKPSDIHSFEELVRYLTNFTTWDGDHVHDVNGAVILLGALLDNIRNLALDVDIENIGNHLTDEQRSFLSLIAEFARNPPEE